MTLIETPQPTRQAPVIRQDTAGGPFAYSDYELDLSDPLAGGCAYLEGEYVPPSEARISMFDAGFMFSDVTYTVFHVWHGNAFRLHEHIRRLVDGARQMTIPVPWTTEEIEEIALNCVSKAQLRESYVSVAITRGYPGFNIGSRSNYLATMHEWEPQLYVYAIPYIWGLTPHRIINGVSAGIARSVRRAGRNTIDPQIKNFAWTDMARAGREVHDRGADLGILLDSDGLIAEGTGFNLFIVKGNRLATPSRNALPGITRKTIVEIARNIGYEVYEGDVSEEELLDADEAFAASTAMGIGAITTIDGKPIGTGCVGPVFQRLLKRYWELMDEPSDLITPVIY